MGDAARFKCKGGLVVTVLALLATTGTAQAEGPVSASGKGIAGGVLLGAELPMLTCAIIGVDDAWPYLVFGGVGAAGGAVGGYFLESEVSAAEPSLYMLAGGMALLVPTLVATLNATAYDPEVDEDLPDGAEPAEKSAPAASPPESARNRRRRSIPFALVDLGSTGLRMGVPAVQVRPSYSQSEIARFSLRQHAEVQVPLMGGSF